MRRAMLYGLVLGALATASASAADVPYWVEPMKKVHDRFKGTPGTFAQFTMAYWAPLAGSPKNMSPEMAKAHELVKTTMKPECWSKWKGADYGNNGGMTIRWAHDNVDKWLQKHNPETVLIMFGTNDLGTLQVKEYEEKTRAVVERCLKNGTVVILSTLPPRSGLQEKAKTFAEAARRIAKEQKVPFVDYFEEVLQRRPDDWDGTLPKFKEFAKDVYQAPTLIAADGVHPSNPKQFQDYSEESLKSNGYALRSYLTLLAYADVIRHVLQPG